jgi:hypothetical protein
VFFVSNICLFLFLNLKTLTCFVKFEKSLANATDFALFQSSAVNLRIMALFNPKTMRKLYALFAASAILAMMVPQISFGFCTDTVAPQYNDAARALFSSNVLRGSNGACNLDASLNRVEFATLVLRNKNTDEQITQIAASEAGSFPDLQAGIWYEQYAKAAKKQGIIKGDDGSGRGRFGDGVNAAEAITITVRGMGLSLPAAKAGEQWFDPAMNVARVAGVTIYPATQAMKRGDAVRMIHEVNINEEKIKTAIANYGSIDQETAKTVNQSKIISMMAGLETLKPNDFLAIFKSLSEQEKAALGMLAPNFFNFIQVNTCEADSTLTFQTQAGVINCAQSTSSLEALAADEAAFVKSLENEFVLLLLGEACKLKNYNEEITPEFCGQFLGSYNNAVDTFIAAFKQPAQSTTTTTQAPNLDDAYRYYDIMSQISASTHNTSMNILKNIGGGTCSSPGSYLSDGSYCSEY